MRAISLLPENRPPGLPQGIDHPVELLSERICFVPAMSVLPGGEKFPAIPAKVSAQTSDAACLALKLRALPVWRTAVPPAASFGFPVPLPYPPISNLLLILKI